MLLSFFIIIVTNFYRSSLSQVSYVNKVLEQYTGFNLLVKNLRLIDFSTLKKINSGISFTEGKNKYSWQFNKNKLVFVKNGAHSLVMNNVNLVKFKIGNDMQKNLVRIITKDGHVFNSCICPRSGVII